MNRCRFIKELDSYWDNQLSGKKKLALEEHLKQCAVCAEELGKLKTLSEKLKTWPAPILESTFDSCVKNKIVALELTKEGVKMKKKTLSILIPSGAVAGILIVSLLSLKVYTERGIAGRLKSGPGDLGEEYGADYARLENANVPLDAERAIEKEKLQNVRGSGQRRNRELAKALRENKFSESGDDRIDEIKRDKYSGVYNNINLARKSKLEPTDISLSNSFEEMPLGVVSSPARIPAAENTSFQGEDSRVIVIQPILPASGVGEMIIRTAELTLEVENGQETYGKIADICREFGGYQAESRFSKNDDGREAGRITLRIPKDKFLAALDKLSELGKVKANNTHSQDVSQEYANLKSQLEAAKIVYEKMLEALKKRQTGIPEAIRLESELTPVLRKLEELKNQIERLNNLTSFTIITVNFYEAEVSAKVLEETKKLVKENMLAAKINAVRYLATHLPLVGLVAGFTIAVFTLFILLSIFITRLKKRS